jgi:hypothetical protein
LGNDVEHLVDARVDVSKSLSYIYIYEGVAHLLEGVAHLLTLSVRFRLVAFFVLSHINLLRVGEPSRLPSKLTG